jgi:hypothetical protein
METSPSANYRSVAAQQLVQLGDCATQASLGSVVGRLPDDALPLLEDELEFFVLTGFVGILMSEVLSEFLHCEAIRLAA